MKGKAPAYLRNLVPGNVDARTRYSLHNRGDIDWRATGNYRIDNHSNSFFPVASRNWNEMRDDIKNLTSVESFKY
jgi:hypothetical protein